VPIISIERLKKFVISRVVWGQLAANAQAAPALFTLPVAHLIMVDRKITADFLLKSNFPWTYLNGSFKLAPNA
jgi:hypothetical protein